MSDAFIVSNGCGGEATAQVALVLEQHGRSVRAVETVAALVVDPAFTGARRRAVVLLAREASAATEADLVAFVEGPGRGTATVYVADSLAAATYKRLLRAGGEWLTREALRRELPETLRRIEGPAAEDAPTGAVITAFLPAKGGVGNTMLAAECGYDAARRAGKTGGRVAVIDLNVQSAALADLLDLEARLDFSEILGRPERLDARLAEIFASRHGSGLDVYASASRGLVFEEVNGRALFALIDRLSQLYTAVHVDLPALRFSWTETLLAGADAVVATGTSDVPALRRLAEDAAVLDRLGVDRKRTLFVVNRCDTTLLGGIARKGEIERVLPDREVLMIRRDEALAGEAADLGRPILEFAPKKPLGRDIRALAERLATAAPAATPPGVRADAA